MNNNFIIFNWIQSNFCSFKGERGEVGLTGLLGARGLKGLQGETGSAGFYGVSGIKGEAGPQGRRGIPGVAGLPGLKVSPCFITPSIYNDSNQKKLNISSLLFRDREETMVMQAILITPYIRVHMEMLVCQDSQVNWSLSLH